ncbi:MAG: proline dehydrogenase, partial [Chloroflexota bacterium]|nr:proline dehydrogenase [Chloroflexota bacterium]
MQSLLRRPMLALAERETIERVVRQSRLVRGLVRRFVAGDTLDDALTVARQIAAMKMTTTLDLLGENVVTVEAARSAATAYAEILRRMAA